jgi:hypothetical protein
MDSARCSSRLGEHLVVLLVVATILVGFVATVPSLTAKATDTAGQAQERVNRPAMLLAELDAAP